MGDEDDSSGTPMRQHSEAEGERKQQLRSPRSAAADGDGDSDDNESRCDTAPPAARDLFFACIEGVPEGGSGGDDDHGDDDEGGDDEKERGRLRAEATQLTRAWLCALRVGARVDLNTTEHGWIGAQVRWVRRRGARVKE
jgi:hypothetical protein